MKKSTKISKLKSIRKISDIDITKTELYYEFVELLDLTTANDIILIASKLLSFVKGNSMTVSFSNDGVSLLKNFHAELLLKNTTEIKEFIVNYFSKLLMNDFILNNADNNISICDYVSRKIYMYVYNVVSKQFNQSIIDKITTHKTVKQVLLSFINNDIEIDGLLATLQDYNNPESRNKQKRFLRINSVVPMEEIDILFNQYHEDFKSSIIKLNNIVYSKRYQYHPFTRNVSLKDSCTCMETPKTVVWLNILSQVGIPKNCIHKYLILCLASNVNFSYEDIMSTNFETMIDGALDTFKFYDNYFRLAICVFAASANLYDTMKYCIDNGWTVTMDNNLLFIDHVLTTNASAETVRIIIDTMETFDIWDQKGFRSLHRLITAGFHEKHIVFLILYLVTSGKTDISPCSKDKIDLVTWCEKNDVNIVKEFILNYRSSSNILLRVRKLFFSWTGIKDVNIVYHIEELVNDYNKMIITKFDNLYDVITIHKLNTNELDKLTALITLLDQNKIKYSRSDLIKSDVLYINKNSFLEYEERITKEKIIEKKHKKELRKYQKSVIDLTNEDTDESSSPFIMSVPSGKSREKKITHEIEKYEVKFTDTDRDVVYIKLYEQNHLKLYRLFTPTRVYDKPVELSLVPKLTLNNFKHRIMEILGSEYLDEIVYIVFAQQYFDPKSSSAFEKSVCNSHYVTFTSRNIEIVDNEQISSTEEKLVELVNPFKIMKNDKNIVSKKSDRPISLNLKSAKHEFLFLKGLFTWKNELIKPDSIHDDIFEDCLRLGAVRFYNSILLYAIETKSGSLGYFVENITYDDHEAAKIRNVLAHNFCSIDEIKLDVEQLVFKLGERIVDMCNGIKVGIANISLTKSIFFTMKVKTYDPLVDGLPCRNSIKDKLMRIKKYISLMESKESLDKGSMLLNSLSKDWDIITPTLKIWIHHARAIESCILQIGELSKGTTKFLNPKVQNYVKLCREVRHIAYHINVKNESSDGEDEWNFDPIASDFLADLIKGSYELNI